ncbi:MAG: helix-turn-helix domain-containing protein [Clostridia bacterium]|nr:helix-turn-helix domain-containing protein [Clostridia bacterium]
MNYIDYKVIGERIKRARRQESLTQDQLAEQLGVSIGYVSQVERGITKISLDLLAKIGFILHRDVSEFISDSGKKSESYLYYEAFDKFRILNERDRNTILMLIQHLASHSGDQ